MLLSTNLNGLPSKVTVRLGAISVSATPLGRARRVEPQSTSARRPFAFTHDHPWPRFTPVEGFTFRRGFHHRPARSMKQSPQRSAAPTFGLSLPRLFRWSEVKFFLGASPTTNNAAFNVYVGETPGNLPHGSWAR